LKRFFIEIPYLQALLITSSEGLPVASALPRGVDETKVAGMTAALLSLAERAVIEMEKGEFNQLYVKGSQGYIIALEAGDYNILASLNINAKLGFAFFSLERLANKLISGDFSDFRGDRFPYPYVFKPPSPPGDLGLASQAQLREAPLKEDLWDKPYCKNCGSIISEGQSVCHVCKKRII
jgi:predicted regulator of Ras-like GTPase activity (Roadblock/LC7/MglB family)